MNILIEFSQIVFFNFLIFFIIFFFGNLVSPVFFCRKNGKVFFNILIDVLLGLILIIFIYSIIFSGFKTINLIGAVLIFSYIISNYKNINFTSDFNFNKNQSKVILSALFFLFISTFISYIYPYKGQIDEDIVQYVNISRELNQSGIENIFTYFNSFKAFGLMPYHYVEMWFGSILFKLNIFNFSNAIIFRYCCYSILKSICLLGFLAFIESIKKIKIYDIFIVVILFLFNSLLFTSIINDSYPLHTSVWLRPNLIIYYLFLFPVFTLFGYNYRKLSVLFLLLLVIASTVTAPTVISALFTLCILIYFFNKKNKLHAFILALIILLFSVAILLFYKIFGHSSEEVSKISSFNNLYIYTLSIWKAIVYYLVTVPLRATGIIFPCFFLFLFYRSDFLSLSRKNSTSILFSIFLFLFGLLFFQLTTFMDNTYQFVYVGYCSLTIITLLFFYQLMINSFKDFNNYKSIFFVIAFIILNLWHVSKDLNFNISSHSIAELNLSRKGLSKEYIYKMKDYFSQEKSLKGGYAFGLDSPKNLKITKHKPHSTSQFGSYTYYLSSWIKLFPLSDPEKLYSDVDKNSLFYRRHKVLTDILPFYNMNKKLTYNEKLLVYIEKENINFLVTDINFDLENLEGICVKNTFTDSNLGNKFIIFCD